MDKLTQAWDFNKKNTLKTVNPLKCFQIKINKLPEITASKTQLLKDEVTGTSKVTKR